MGCSRTRTSLREEGRPASSRTAEMPICSKPIALSIYACIALPSTTFGRRGGTQYRFTKQQIGCLLAFRGVDGPSGFACGFWGRSHRKLYAGGFCGRSHFDNESDQVIEPYLYVCNGLEGLSQPRET